MNVLDARRIMRLFNPVADMAARQRWMWRAGTIDLNGDGEFDAVRLVVMSPWGEVVSTEAIPLPANSNEDYALAARMLTLFVSTCEQMQYNRACGSSYFTRRTISSN